MAALPDTETRVKLACLASMLVKATLPGRVTAPGDMHLTLLFLRAARPEQVADLSRVAERLATSTAALRIPALGLCWLPAPSPRMLWLRLALDPEVEKLAGLSAELAGINREQPFWPHFTLYRGQRQRLAQTVQDSARAMPFASVDRINLLRSHLGPQRSRYEILHTSTLRRT